MTPLNTTWSEVVLGLKPDRVFPFAPPLAMIVTARMSIGVNEMAANVSMAPIAIRTPR